MKMIQKCCLAVFSGLLIHISCSIKKVHTLRPGKYFHDQSISLSAGDLSAVFIDNSAFGPDHLPGYNGIASLKHLKEDSSLFVPKYAGFNLEHIFGGDSLVQLFEPRRHPMSLFKKSATEVLLYQESTPLSGVESLTEFRLVPPHYIDVTFKCILHNVKFFNHDYAGFFWASYIEQPEDPRIYFLTAEALQRKPLWVNTYSEQHGVKSTHRSIHDNHQLFFADNFNATLAKNYSEYRFVYPFFYGRFHKMALAYFFDADEVIRFAQSPTGGGPGNPAWDFQYIIPRPKKGKVYSFKSRVMYKPFISKEDIQTEYENWKKN